MMGLFLARLESGFAQEEVEKGSRKGQKCPTKFDRYSIAFYDCGTSRVRDLFYLSFKSWWLASVSTPRTPAATVVGLDHQ